MTPENFPTTPEAEAPRSYTAEAQDIVAFAADQVPEMTSVYKRVDSYIDSILNDADEGKITGSIGVYSREQILQQLNDAYTESMTPKEMRHQPDADPYTFIPRANGLRDSMRLLMTEESTYREVADSLRVHVEAQQRRHEELVSPENIQDMGEVEVSSAGVVEPMAQARRAAEGIIDRIPDHIMNPKPAAAEAAQAAAPAAEATPKLSGGEYLVKLTDGLSDDDKSALRSYADAAEQKAEAQKAGNGDNSMYWGQIQGQSLREMSAAARAVADQYSHAYRHYK